MVSLACFIFCIIYLPTKIVISVFRRDLNLLSHQPNYIYIYIYIQARCQDFGSKGGTSDKISYMVSVQVLYCNGIEKISVRGDIQQKCTHQNLLKNF